MTKAELSPAFRVSFLQALDRSWRKVIRRPDFAEQMLWALRMGELFSTRRMARVAVPVLSIFFVVAFWTLAPRDNAAGISLIRGNAYVSSLSLADWRAGREAAAERGIDKGAQARYGCVLGARDGEATVNIGDKIIMRLDRGTEIYVSRPQDNAFSVSLRRGQVYARTTESFKGSGLCVLTSFSRSSVTGTEFVVQAWPGGSETRVVSGSVKVENIPLSDSAASRAVIVRAGEKSEVLEGETPSLARPMIFAERRAVRRFAGQDIGERESVAGKVSVDSRRTSRESRNTLMPGLF